MEENNKPTRKKLHGEDPDIYIDISIICAFIIALFYVITLFMDNLAKDPTAAGIVTTKHIFLILSGVVMFVWLVLIIQYHVKDRREEE